MRIKYIYIAIIITSIISCSKDLETDEFIPCYDQIEIAELTTRWSDSLFPNSYNYKQISPFYHNGNLIHSIGYTEDGESIIVKRNVETKEIIQQQNVYGLTNENSKIHQDHIIYFTGRKFNSFNLNTFEVNELYSLSLSEITEEIENDFSIIDNKLYFVTELSSNSQINKQQLLSIDINHLDLKIEYEWENLNADGLSIYRYTVVQNESGQRMLTYLDGKGTVDFGILENGFFGQVNLETGDIEYEENILFNYEGKVYIKSVNFFDDVVTIEIGRSNHIEYLAISTKNGEQLWNNKYDLSGNSFQFHYYYEPNNSLIMGTFYDLYEVHLETGEELNKHYLVYRIPEQFFLFDSKIGFHSNYEIRIFDLEIGCWINVIEPDEEIKGDLSSHIFYDKQQKEIYAYSDSLFLAIPYE